LNSCASVGDEITSESLISLIYCTHIHLSTENCFLVINIILNIFFNNNNKDCVDYFNCIMIMIFQVLFSIEILDDLWDEVH